MDRTGIDSPPVRAARGRAAGAWSRRLAVPFVALAALQVVMTFLQAVFAGQLLGGDAGARAAHQVTGTEFISYTAMAQLLLAILLWRPGRGPWWPIVVMAALGFAITAQIAWGFTGQLDLHVPAGVAILLAQVVLLVGTAPLLRTREV